MLPEGLKSGNLALKFVKIHRVISFHVYSCKLQKLTTSSSIHLLNIFNLNYDRGSIES
jgi:hypothetical protein